MSRVLIGNLPPGTTIRNIDDFCSPFGRLLYVDVKNQGNSTLACVEYESIRNSQNLIRARHGYNYNGYTVQLKIMSEDSVSGPPEVRDIKRRQNSPAPSPSASMWSRNNTQSNNRTYEVYDNSNGNSKPSSNFDNDRGNYYNNNSNRGSVPMDTNTGNGLDYNQACRIVYQRFINEGYNPTLAKERTIEFVNNMQGRSNHTGFTNNNISDYFDQTQGRGVGGMYSNNSDYFGQGMNTNNNFGNDSGNFNGSQNWGGGNRNNWGGNADSFSNSNWGSFNGPNNQQMPSSWGGGGGGGMSYPMQGNGFNNRSRRDGWNNGGNNVSNQGRVGGNQRMMGPQGPPPANVVDHESYTKSATIRKKIELKITRGISTPRDLKNLQFHTQIMDDYERHMRFQKKMGGVGVGVGVKVDPMVKLQRYKSALGTVQKLKKLGGARQQRLTPEDQEIFAKNKLIVTEYEKAAEIASLRKNGKDELNQLNRYKSALGLVQKLKKLGPILQLSPEDKKSYDKNKLVVDEYEKSIAALVKGKGAGRAIGTGPISGTKSNVAVSAAAAFERKKQQLIKEMKKNYPNSDFRLSGAANRKMRSLMSVGIEGAEAKYLALHSSLVVKELIDLKNAITKLGNANGGNKQLVPVGAKPKPAVGKSKPGAPQTKSAAAPADPSTAKPTGMTKREKDGMRAANRIINRYESKDAEIESLTEKDIVQLRMSIRRLQRYNEKYDTPVRKSKYDVLLSEKYDKKVVEKKPEETSATKDGEAMEEGNNDEVEGGENVEGEDAAEGEEVEGGEDVDGGEEEVEGVEEEAEGCEDVEDDQGVEEQEEE